MSYSRYALLRLAESCLRRTPMASLTSVARACGVSIATTRRTVRAQTGLSYRKWRQALLCTRAEALLGGESPLSIKEISADLGFATPQSFARWLKRARGSTPTVFRQHTYERTSIEEAEGSPD